MLFIYCHVTCQASLASVSYMQNTSILLLSCPSHIFPTCWRMPLPALSLWPGRKPCRPRLVGDTRGGGPSPVAPRCRNPPTGRRRDSPISSSLCSHGPPCAQSAKGSPTEPVLSRYSRQRLGHLQSHYDGGGHVCLAVVPEPQYAATCRRVERRDCTHEALPRLQSASSWLVMEQLVAGVCRLSGAFHATGNSPPDVKRGDTVQVRWFEAALDDSAAVV